MYIVSACLLGQNCKYNGGNNRNEDVVEFCRTHKYVTVCPESAGRLPSPRPPAEKVGSKIMDKNGNDLTEAFIRGAEISLKSCMEMARLSGEEIEGAILKANSPSCGVGHIYDGTFSGTLTEGNGVFAGMLRRLGIETITEKEKIKW
ncbi:MAG: DUF523 domain-containing protein [Firmicutes bacterium]|nr:DUF523 domain-containing protein [Bacillota bacterium]